MSATSFRFRLAFVPSMVALIMGLSACTDLSLGGLFSNGPGKPVASAPPPPASSPTGKVDRVAVEPLGAGAQPPAGPVMMLPGGPEGEGTMVVSGAGAGMTGAPASTDQVRVALLLPLSGTSAPLGEAMLNSAQMALFETAGPNLLLQVYDTGASNEEATIAAGNALNEGSRLLIGPVFSGAVKAVAPMARSAGVSMLSFSTDPSAAGEGVYLTGFLIRQQVARVVAFARSRGLATFGALAPSTDYGRAVVAALREVAAGAGGQVIDVQFYDPNAANLTPVVKRLAQHKPFDAVLIADKGPRLKALASQMPYYDIDLQQTRLIGTQIWTETDFRGEPSLVGGWFATPSSALQKPFAERYKALFGGAAPPNSSLAYDAVALASVLARGTGATQFDEAALTSRVGFAGIDGIFRLRRDGISERGLAVFEVGQDGPVEISPAPETFEPAVF